MRALGVDVSVRRGLDLVVLEDAPEPAALRSDVSPEALPGIIAELHPDVITIDSPPAWGVGGGSRRAEQELRRLGIQSYGTPSDPRKGDSMFYAWMKVGFRAFAACETAGFPLYHRGSARGRTMEVFPHATAVVLGGCLPPAAVPKHTWRISVLRAQGLEVSLLRTPDLIDAALAAVTGLYALRGECVSLGEPDEGVIVLPTRALPTHPYRRCTHPPPPAPQLTLPGLSPCACGDPQCHAMTSREFAPGHDAKRKSQLWEQARRGEAAREELRRRGWELPPELKNS
jgi:predicted nuclease with RNAse H fold